jgi:hypothetical protein
MSLLDMCRRTARRMFGTERLRREQESAMVAILNGRDARVALSTGFGNCGSTKFQRSSSIGRRWSSRTHCPHGRPGTHAQEPPRSRRRPPQRTASG